MAKRPTYGDWRDNISDEHLAQARDMQRERDELQGRMDASDALPAGHADKMEPSIRALAQKQHSLVVARRNRLLEPYRTGAAQNAPQAPPARKVGAKDVAEADQERMVGDFASRLPKVPGRKSKNNPNGGPVPDKAGAQHLYEHYQVAQLEAMPKGGLPEGHDPFQVATERRDRLAAEDAERESRRAEMSDKVADLRERTKNANAAQREAVAQRREANAGKTRAEIDAERKAAVAERNNATVEHRQADPEALQAAANQRRNQRHFDFAPRSASAPPEREASDEENRDHALRMGEHREAVKQARAAGTPEPEAPVSPRSAAYTRPSDFGERAARADKAMAEQKIREKNAREAAKGNAIVDPSTKRVDASSAAQPTRSRASNTPRSSVTSTTQFGSSQEQRHAGFQAAAERKIGGTPSAQQQAVIDHMKAESDRTYADNAAKHTPETKAKAVEAERARLTARNNNRTVRSTSTPGATNPVQSSSSEAPVAQKAAYTSESPGTHQSSMAAALSKAGIGNSAAAESAPAQTEAPAAPEVSSATTEARSQGSTSRIGTPQNPHSNSAVARGARAHRDAQQRRVITDQMPNHATDAPLAVTGERWAPNRADSPNNVSFTREGRNNSFNTGSGEAPAPESGPQLPRFANVQLSPVNTSAPTRGEARLLPAGTHDVNITNADRYVPNSDKAMAAGLNINPRAMRPMRAPQAPAPVSNQATQAPAPASNATPAAPSAPTAQPDMGRIGNFFKGTPAIGQMHETERWRDFAPTTGAPADKSREAYNNRVANGETPYQYGDQQAADNAMAKHLKKWGATGVAAPSAPKDSSPYPLSPGARPSSAGPEWEHQTDGVTRRRQGAGPNPLAQHLSEALGAVEDMVNRVGAVHPARGSAPTPAPAAASAPSAPKDSSPDNPLAEQIGNALGGTLGKGVDKAAASQGTSVKIGGVTTGPAAQPASSAPAGKPTKTSGSAPSAPSSAPAGRPDWMEGHTSPAAPEAATPVTTAPAPSRAGRSGSAPRAEMGGGRGGFGGGERSFNVGGDFHNSGTFNHNTYNINYGTNSGSIGQEGSGSGRGGYNPRPAGGGRGGGSITGDHEGHANGPRGNFFVKDSKGNKFDARNTYERFTGQRGGHNEKIDHESGTAEPATQGGGSYGGTQRRDSSRLKNSNAGRAPVATSAAASGTGTTSNHVGPQAPVANPASGIGTSNHGKQIPTP